MRGRLQSCRRSQATRNRLDPWSLPLASLSPAASPHSQRILRPRRKSPWTSSRRRADPGRASLAALVVGRDPARSANDAAMTSGANFGLVFILILLTIATLYFFSSL